MSHTISAHAGLPREESYHHSLKFFFHETSSLLSVLDPGEPTDLSKLASPSARDAALAVLELGMRCLHFYLSRADTGTSGTHTLPVLCFHCTSLHTGDFCTKDTQH